MRKRLLSVLMIPLLLLGGCWERENDPEDALASFRETLNAADSLQAAITMTADHGGTVSEYALTVTDNAERTTVTIREPENLAGVTAYLEAGEASLAYEGVILGAGAVDEAGTTPLSSIPAIIGAMRDGYAELCWRDGDFTAARIRVTDASTCTVWLTRDTNEPVAAELASEGRTVITCRFTEWRTETTKDKG